MCFRRSVMLVLKSSLEQTKQELSAQQNVNQELRAKINSLESEKQALEQTLAQEASSQATFDKNPILDNLLDSLSQVQSIRESMNLTYENLGSGSESESDISGLFSQSGSSLKEIIKNMEQLSSRMSHMSESISGLSETADNINKFVSTITSISDQTNLLALNAAIEAARAGDAGRGFSVVADEVRALATETNTSASEVADLVQKIINSTREAVDAVGELKSNNEHLSDGVQTLNSSYDEIVNRCGTMQDKLSSSSISSFIQVAKLDHLAWKSSIYAAVCGKNSAPSEDMFNVASSRLGNWISEQSGNSISSKPAFREISQPFSRVLQEGRNVINELQASNQAAMSKSLTSMEGTSNTLMTVLDRLASEAY